MKTLLVTTYYNDRVKERDSELLTCIRANLTNKAIDSVVVLVEKGTVLPFNHPKLIWEWTEERPKFSSFVHYANKYNYGLKIIANTDIYFDEYNLGIVKSAILENECYALSRWDLQLSGHSIHHCSRDSQDVWIFKGNIRKFNSDFFIGKAGIDNRIAHEIAEVGYDVINPSKTIKSYHLHITGVRNYRRVEGEVIPKPYKLIPPTYLGEKLKTDMRINERGEEIKVPIEHIDGKPTEYNRDVQDKMMKDMLREGNIPRQFLLSICIPTIHARKGMYKELVKELNRQIVKYKLFGKVEIWTESDNGFAPIGWKRNKMNIECHGHYVAHLDDDDKVSEDYLFELVKAIEGNYGVDVITFDAELTKNGEFPERMYFNRKYKENHAFAEGDNKYRERMPCHLNAIKRECALEHSFIVINKNGAKNRKERGDNGSDVHYSLDMVRDNTLKTDVHIDKILYHYLYRNK